MVAPLDVTWNADIQMDADQPVPTREELNLLNFLGGNGHTNTNGNADAPSQLPASENSTREVDLIVEPIASTQEPAELPARRARGRPPKTVEPIASTQEPTELPARRGRGRPPKTPNGSFENPRDRSSPPARNAVRINHFLFPRYQCVHVYLFISTSTMFLHSLGDLAQYRYYTLTEFYMNID